ncbi:MAG: hypothetical protein IKQ46_11850, partial [Bacteroidales bacterium]|nr:hypothetical protein [Bacteroidales bacterium]
YERHNAGAIMPTYYMIRVKSFDDNVKTAMDEWMEFLKNSEIKSDTKVPGLVEAKEVMKFDRMSKEEQNAYIRHLDAVANEKEAILTAKIWGKIEGRAEGRKEKALAIAKNAKAMGLSIEQIMQLTNLDGETIEKL